RGSLLALLLAAPALAQVSGVAEIASYQGADREQRLIEGAKRERELTFYSSIPPEDIAALVSAFDKKYGVKVKVWRADSEGFRQRIMHVGRGLFAHPEEADEATVRLFQGLLRRHRARRRRRRAD